MPISKYPAFPLFHRAPGPEAGGDGERQPDMHGFKAGAGGEPEEGIDVQQTPAEKRAFGGVCRNSNRASADASGCL